MREVDAVAVAGARGARCLVFESERAMRLICRYPARWRELSDQELMALSWQR